MRADQLSHKKLLELDADGGVLRFAGQRALLLDSVAMGLLRKYLVENFGLNAARIILTQFGFAHGWRMAEALSEEFKWQSAADMRNAGTRIPALQGLFHVVLGREDPLSLEGLAIDGSYEAEQHLLHFGRSEIAVCWTLCGLTSGYLSRTLDREIFVIEGRCICKGDTTCQLFGRTREEWGADRAHELGFFDSRRLAEALDISLQRVTQTLRDIEEKLRIHQRALARVAAADVEDPLEFSAKSGAMRKLLDLTRRVAKVDSTILITGESGTGKERIAKLIHDESMRAAGPFIAVNCGAIAESLFESELFGHARGAFTGAIQDRPGLFEAANGGTLLLDEVGEVSPGMQVKLLRALQEREVRRVGENKSRSFNVRVIAATNLNLDKEIDAGNFRQDLYYRLRVVELHVPALRERKEDILPLAQVLLAGAAVRLGREVEGFAPGVADQFLRYTWPGNVRELENAMERAVALARGSRVEIEDLPEEIRTARPYNGAIIDTRVQSLAEVEEAHILRVLGLNEGNQTLTARQLKIAPTTLYRKLKKYHAANA